MITVTFHRNKEILCGFDMSGHAGYDESGYDIVCAGASTAVQMISNAITEILEMPASLVVEDNRIALSLKDGSVIPESVLFLESFSLQMQLMEEEYPEYITLNYVEV